MASKQFSSEWPTPGNSDLSSSSIKMDKETDRSAPTTANIDTQYTRLIENFIALTVQQSKKTLILRKILPYALTLSNAKLGALLVVQSVEDSPIKNLTLISQHGMPAEIIHRLTSGELREQLKIDDQANPGIQIIQLNIIQTLLNKYNISSLIGLPLQSQGRTLGTLVLGAKKRSEDVFNPNARQRLSTLAQLASVFLDHVRLQTDNQRLQTQPIAASTPPEQKRLDFNTDSIDDLERLLEAVMSAEEEVINHNTDLDMLNQLSGELAGTLNLHKILNKAISKTRGALNAEVGWIYLFENDMLILYAHQGLSKKYAQALKELRPGNGAEGMAFARNEAIIRDTILFHNGPNRDILKEENIQVVAATPLSVSRSPFGVLCVANHGENSNWTSRDEYMLVSIGQRVAQAILNARMFTELQSKAEDLEIQNQYLQNHAVQLSEDFNVLKTQIAEILKYQEQVWLSLPKSEDPHELIKKRGEMIQSGEHVVTMIKRALEVISKT